MFYVGASSIAYTLQNKTSFALYNCLAINIILSNRFFTFSVRGVQFTSRIVCLEQLHLLSFNPSKIYCNEEAKLEALAIKARALNRQFTKWNERQRNCFKLSSLNVRSLQKHFKDLKDDNFLQQSDILCVNETWLFDDPDTSFEDFSSHYLNERSKGIAMFTRVVPEEVQKLHTKTCRCFLPAFKCLICCQFTNLLSYLALMSLLNKFWSMLI